MDQRNIPLKYIYMTREVASRTMAHGARKLLDDLTASIEKQGVLNPIIVDATKQGRQYRLVDGAFRLMALMDLDVAKKIDRQTYMVPCLVRPYQPAVVMTSDYHAPFAQEIFDEEAVMAPALFDFQIKMIKELQAKGRMALDLETDTGKVQIGGLFNAYQAEKRAHRVGQPHKAVNFMIQGDFTGVELALAKAAKFNEDYGRAYAERDAYFTRMLYEQWNRPKERYFDLEDTW